jgi:hypothetical protein
MKRVIRFEILDVSPSGIKDGDICVARAKAGRNIYILASKYNGHERRYFFQRLNKPLDAYGTAHSSIPEAINSLMDNNANVFVLDSLKELADWIRDNS